MKKYRNILLALLSGLLLSLGWPANGFSFLLLLALVPLLFIEDNLCADKNNNSRFAILPYAYITFFLWNALTTWWIFYSTLPGAIMAVVFNSLFMSLVFFFFHITRRNIYSGFFQKKNYGYLVLISYWITFEYFHMDWDLTWSWLNLGNGFANYYKFIQWYEYTGVLGGTVWILLANIMIYQLIKTLIYDKGNRRKLIINLSSVLALIFLPSFISLYMYATYKEQHRPVEIVVIQPNIDPYNEKFSGMSANEQIERIISLSELKLTPQTAFLVAPETSMPEGVWVDELNYAPTVLRLRKILENHSQLGIVIGASTYKLYNSDDEKTPTARDYPNYAGSYDVFNSALYIDTSSRIGIYHKSKLVPGVEKMPYPQIFGFLESLAIDLGGMVGTHGTQKERSVFENNGIKVAPVICYESIYGDFVTGYIRNGAHFIFIITNDGWWEDTPGHRQHSAYARLRAIETRRSVARSANTGISSFINQRGDMFQQTSWWEPAVIAQKLNANDKITFYVMTGDYIGRILSFLTVLLALFTIATIIMNFRNKKI